MSLALITQTNLSFLIGFNKNHQLYRRRFTIAHEIGHLLMGHTCSNSKENNSEIEANTFASELLIPTKFIKRDFREEPNAIPQLAKRYCVSQ